MDGAMKEHTKNGVSPAAQSCITTRKNKATPSQISSLDIQYVLMRWDAELKALVLLLPVRRIQPRFMGDYSHAAIGG